MTPFLMILVSAAVVGIMVALIPHVVWLLWFAGVALCGGSAPRYAPFGWIALGLALAVWLMLAYGFFVGRFRMEVKPVTYSDARLPEAFRGYKIVHISDLHLATYDDRPAALQDIVNKINEQQPDLICFTGDLVSLSPDEALPYAKVLQQLHTRDGVVSVLGNHDMMIYSASSADNRNAALERIAAFERDTLGWHLLRNGHYIVTREEDSITIVGVDNTACGSEGFRTICAGDLTQALCGTDGFRILLTHDPSHWKAEVVPQTDIPLTLSGHTHSGQMRLFGHALSDLLFSERAGWNKEGEQSLYLTSGVGCTLPARINCPSEITVITLQ